jgi:hypothetical protein
MVAVPMTPAAPVTTATLPSRRISIGHAWRFPVAPVDPDFPASARARERPVGSDYFIWIGG